MSSYQRHAVLDAGALDPIVVVGYSCMFPGDANDAQSFWKMMLEGRSAMAEMPDSRMSLSGWHHPAKGRRGQVRNIHLVC
jgi:acyl transferase domain-containing protein